MLFAGSFIIGSGVLAIDHVFQTHWFNSKTEMALSICVYIPLLVVLRGRYLKMTRKDFFMLLIPGYGWIKQMRLFQKP
jgi:hypothetical protein